MIGSRQTDGARNGADDRFEEVPLVDVLRVAIDQKPTRALFRRRHHVVLRRKGSEEGKAEEGLSQSWANPFSDSNQHLVPNHHRRVVLSHPLSLMMIEF